jgi:hypothetical protein
LKPVLASVDARWRDIPADASEVHGTCDILSIRADATDLSRLAHRCKVREGLCNYVTTKSRIWHVRRMKFKRRACGHLWAEATLGCQSGMHSEDRTLRFAYKATMRLARSYTRGTTEVSDSFRYTVEYWGGKLEMCSLKESL